MIHIRRLLKAKLVKYLSVSPIVFLNGPRQAGKSTLVQTIAKDEFFAEYVTFDSTTQIAAAVNSPISYLKERSGSLIIDEVQLVPDIFRALKIVIDELRQSTSLKLSGKFLLTGSANILTMPKLADSLVGRMTVLTLYPIASSEALGGHGNFIKSLFNKDFSSGKTDFNLIDVMQKSTFPEVIGLDKFGKEAWFEGYLTTILQRDVRALSQIDKLSSLPSLLRVLASRAGNLINDADIARSAGLNQVTARNYKTILKMLFLTFEVPSWYRNIGKRLVKAPKGYMTDTLLLCHLLQFELSDLKTKRPEFFGHILENFVASELLKLKTFFDEKLELFHFRTSDKKEVDFVLEKPNSELAAIEVKMNDQVSISDFKGLIELKQITKKDFICGIVLYCGKEVVPFGESLWAVPIAALWS